MTPSLSLLENDSLFLYEYIPWRSSRRNEITNLILEFKKNNADAVVQIQMDMIKAFYSLVPYLRDNLCCRYIVSIPSSREGFQNTPCEEVCIALAAVFPWLTHLPGALQRIITVQKSSQAEPGSRPTYTTHLNSIRYTGPSLHTIGQTIIMVDDVITRGETSKACRDILKQATHCNRVLGLFVGKTSSV
jgi:predicted amidophosphoribosyltransferase